MSVERVIGLYGVERAGKTPTLNDLIRQLDNDSDFRLIDIQDYYGNKIGVSSDDDKLATFLHKSTNKVVCIATKGDGADELYDNIKYFESSHCDEKTKEEFPCNVAISACRPILGRKELNDFAKKHQHRCIWLEKQKINNNVFTKSDSKILINEIKKLIL